MHHCILCIIMWFSYGSNLFLKLKGLKLFIHLLLCHWVSSINSNASVFKEVFRNSECLSCCFLEAVKHQIFVSFDASISGTFNSPPYEIDVLKVREERMSYWNYFYLLLQYDESLLNKYFCGAAIQVCSFLFGFYIIPNALSR